MSPDLAWLALQLAGPMQSWGFDSQYNLRKTGLMPTRSAVIGMCCAALGVDRGSPAEERILENLSQVRMTAITIPRTMGKKPLPIRRIVDYHTVLETRKADGGIKDSHITYRYYLADAQFGVVLEGGKGVLQEVAQGLQDPRWGVWLGRKCCIPTAPVLVGLFLDREAALKALLGEAPLESFTRQEEVGIFSEGRDTVGDVPLSFRPATRRFATRRVRTSPGSP